MNEFAMHDAAKDGDLEKVRQLIEAGVPVDSLDEGGRTPLHRAARGGQYEVAELLINSKCNINLKNHYGLTPLMSAAAWGIKDIVDLLLHRGAQVNCTDKNGWTLLHWASYNTDWTDIVRLILDNGEADPNAQGTIDRVRDTPLILAARRGHADVAALLIRAGADVNLSGRLKRTALHFAADGGHTSLIQILLEKEGLHLSPQDNYGDTPLHLAGGGFDHHKEAMTLLLDAGADPNVENNRGQTALNTFIMRQKNITHEEIRLFVQKGTFLTNCDYECISLNPFLKENVLKDVELLTASVVNEFDRQSLPALNNIAYFARRLPNVDNFKLGARHIDDVKNLVKCEIERNTFCNVVKVHPISLSALCVLSLITCQSGKKRAASTGFGYSPFKKNRT